MPLVVFSQNRFEDVVKAMQLGNIKAFDPEGFSRVRKAAVYGDLVLGSGTEGFRGAGIRSCPNLMYNIDLKNNQYFTEGDLLERMEHQIKTEQRLKEGDKARFITQIKEEPFDVYQAAGFFLIGQAAYLREDYYRAANAFMISQDLFRIAKAEELILARVDMAATLSRLKAKGEIDLEKLVMTDGRLFQDSFGGKSITNLLQHLLRKGENPCVRKVDPLSSDGLLIRTYNLYWKYVNVVKIDLNSLFRTPHKDNSLVAALVDAEKEVEEKIEIDQDSMRVVSDSRNKNFEVGIRALKDPLVNTFLFNRIQGANDLVPQFRRDEDLLRQFGTMSDFMLTKSGLKYDLSISCATWKPLKYNPAESEIFEKDLRQIISNVKKNNLQKSLLYKHLANHFYVQNQLDSAAFYIRKTYQVQQKILPGLKLARKNAVLGFFNYLEGNYETALAKSLQAIEKQTNDPTAFYTHHTLGLIYKAQGDIVKALEHFESATRLIEQNLSELKRESSREFFIQATYDTYNELVDIYAIQRRSEDVFNTIAKSKNQLLRQSISRRAQLVDQDLIRYQNAYKDEINEINQASDHEESDQETVDVLNGFYHLMYQGEREHEQLRYVSEIADAQAPVQYKYLKNYIAENEVYLLFDESGDSVTCYMYDHRNLERNELTKVALCSKTELETLMLDFRRDFVEEKGKTSYEALFKSIRPIYEKVWEKIESKELNGTKMIAGKNLIIDPVGALHYFPFELIFNDAKPDEDGIYNYLIKNHDIRYALLLNQKKKQVDYEKDLLAFGNPIFNNAFNVDLDTAGFYRGEKLVALPHTRNEIEAIAAQFADDRKSIFTAQKATEDNFKKLSTSGELDHYRLIHFATHGLVDYENPEFSAIALNQDKNPQEDGFIQYFEIVSKDVKLNAELVVLSACETGLGQLSQTEGMNSLANAFVKSGAKGVVMSKWKVLDSKTASFFQDFYKELMNSQSKNKAEILAEIKRDWINRGVFPYYWAGFVYFGT